MWWAKDVSFDSLIAERFGKTHQAAVLGELYGWRKQPEGRLAEIIVLDQFSRNLYRDRPAAFSADPMALALAQEAIAGAHDQSLPANRRLFFYMPYMHSESRLIHLEAVRLFTALGLQENLEFELRHKAIIDRFGRYPHRNALLGRESTPEELAFLQAPGSSF
jgi:uncharacterized protein (DUF924 family)